MKNINIGYMFFSLFSSLGILSSDFKRLEMLSSRKYQVDASNEKAPIILVPSSCHENSQLLTIAAYQSLGSQEIDKIILILESDVVFYGIALPLTENDFHIDMDEQSIYKLSKSSLFHYYATPFFLKTALQKQLLFIDRYFKGVKVIPLIVGNLLIQDASVVVDELASLYTDKTLIIISADVDHYENIMGNISFFDSIVCKVYDRDTRVIQSFGRGSMNEIKFDVDADSGSSLFFILFEFLKLPFFKSTYPYFVGYDTSSSFSDCKSVDNVESYASFIFRENVSKSENMLGRYEQLQLLKSARQTLCNLYDIPFKRVPYMISYQMMQPSGLFVSLYSMSDHGLLLRGCMGQVQSFLPLYKSMFDMVEEASFYDLRFSPIMHQELNRIVISISIITTLDLMTDYADINEQDGAILKYDNQMAIYLPSTIPNHNWSYDIMLSDLSQQIGLSPESWKNEKASIFSFQSFVIQEE